MNTAENEIIAFADRYLEPYHIKNKYDGIEIIPKYCPYCKGGSHNDVDTFALSITRGCFVCKRGSCGVNGRIEQLVEYLGAPRINFKTGDAKIMQASQHYITPDVALNPPTDVIYEYFQSRGISRKTVDLYKIASDAKGNIIFPFFDSNCLTYVKYRRPRPPQNDTERRSKEWQIPNTKPILFGMDSCAFNMPLVITEGQIDALSLAQIGVPNAVSVPCGCDNLSWIENCYEWLEKFKMIILFGDNDAPGRKMVDEVSKRLDETRCMIVRTYPNGVFGTPLKDANEILTELGAEILEATFGSAEQIEISGMIDVGDIQPYDPQSVERIAYGIPSLDELLGGMEEGCITIISGRSGDGKSTITNQFVLNAVEQGKKVAIYSGELKKEKLIYWLCLQAAGSDYIGLKYDRIRDKKIPSIEWQVQKRITDWLSGNVFLFDNEQTRPKDEHEIDTVMRLFSSTARRYSPFLFVIDNVMSLVSDQTEEFAAQRSMIVKLKSFAQRFKCHIILIAHPRKSGTRQNNVLDKDSVSGSSSMVNFCDSAFSVERPNCRILKNRDGGMNRLIECCYMQDCRRIYEMDKGDRFNQYSWDKRGCPMPSEKANTMYGITMPEIQPF